MHIVGKSTHAWDKTGDEPTQSQLPTLSFSEWGQLCIFARCDPEEDIRKCRNSATPLPLPSAVQCTAHPIHLAVRTARKEWQQMNIQCTASHGSNISFFCAMDKHVEKNCIRAWYG
jgi:hypothetical protein